MGLHNILPKKIPSLPPDNPGGEKVKKLPSNTGHSRDLGLIPGLGRSPGEGMAIHISILAWKIPRTEDLGRLQSMGSQRVGREWACAPIPVHFSSLIPSVDIHSCHLLFDHFQFALIHGLDIPGSYAIFLFTASDLASITSHIHSWVLFLLLLHPFILSGVISPLNSSSILGTYWPGEFLFKYPIILLFHPVHGVLKARILKWLAIPFSSGPHSVRPLHHDPPVLGCPAGMA